MLRLLRGWEDFTFYSIDTRGAAGRVQAHGPFKTTIILWCVGAAAPAFYFAKSREDCGLAGLTPYRADGHNHLFMQDFQKISDFEELFL